MKKIVTVMVVLLLLVGCNKEEESGGIGGCSIDEEVECSTDVSK